MYITCIHIVTWSPLWTTFQFLAKFQELPEALYDYLYDFGFLGQKEEESYVNAMVEGIFQTPYFVRLDWTATQFVHLQWFKVLDATAPQISVFLLAQEFFISYSDIGCSPLTNGSVRQGLASFF